MATPNQRFSDALLRRQHQLRNFSNDVTSNINGLLDGTEASVREMLGDRLASIIERGYDAGPETTSRLRVLADTIENLRNKGFQAAEKLWSRDLQAVVKAEAAFVDRAIQEISPVLFDTVIPDAEVLASLVGDEPILGKVLEDWVSSMKAGDVQRITNAVQQGLVKGDSMDAIARSVFGARAMRGADGVTELTRRDAMNFTRTAVSSFTNQARDEYAQANAESGLFEEERYTATLDSRTTALCRSLDGNIYKIGEGPIPGRDTHWQCRSVRVPVLVGLPNFGGTRPSETGSVPASTTYEEWLRAQSDDFQDSILGPARAEKFRDGGLSLKSFVNTDSGRQWNLAELRRQEPHAWSE